jgi:hypothetical protein
MYCHMALTRHRVQFGNYIYWTLNHLIFTVHKYVLLFPNLLCRLWLLQTRYQASGSIDMDSWFVHFLPVIRFVMGCVSFEVTTAVTMNNAVIYRWPHGRSQPFLADTYGNFHSFLVDHYLSWLVFIWALSSSWQATLPAAYSDHFIFLFLVGI